jgi:hypothetical protein
MAKLLFARIAGGLGLISLALFCVGLTPFLGADPTAGAGLTGRASSYTVNREFKGDRLPVSNVDLIAKDVRRLQHPGEIPVGCDPSFSPISAPRLAYIYGRCTT